MKILHTSDWHIGKKLINKDRLPEQAEVLDEIIQICEREQIELVLVAGDIFDTYTPSAEAEELFYEKIKKVAGENRVVLAISGNHDDGVRLSAVAPLSEEQGVYIVGNARLAVSLKNSGRKVKPVRSGKGYAVFENERGERAYIGMLPYPNEARFKEEKSELPYIERMQGWIGASMGENTDNLPSILMAHIFVAGGKVSLGEREIDLGGARAIPVNALPNCNYIALGHLHKKQRMGENLYYSGSPLQYAFDETADKSVKVFDLTANGVENLQDIPLTSGKKLVRLRADGVESAETLLKQYENDYVELTLRLKEPLSTTASTTLAGYKNLASTLIELKTETEQALTSRKHLSDGELFDAYFQSVYDSEPKKELKELFLSALAETQE